MTFILSIISLRSVCLTRTCSPLSTRLSPSYPRLFIHLSQGTPHCKNFGKIASNLRCVMSKGLATSSTQPASLATVNRFPSIPRIIREETRTHVFRHPFLITLKGGSDTSKHSKDNNGAASHKGFEHLGDRVIGLVICEMIWSMYPGLDNGSFTRIFSVVVSNATLALVSLRCGLPEMARDMYGIDPSRDLPGKPVHWQADILEAYIGGLYYEQGQVTTRAKKWIKHLLSPHVIEAHAALSMPRFFTPNVTEDTPATGKHASPTASPVRTSSKRPTSSTQQLDEAVHCIAQFVKDAVDQKAEKENTMSADLQKLLDRVPNEGKSVRWSTVLVNLEQKSFWVAVVRVDNAVLGRGVSPSLKAAKNAAVRQALESHAW